MSEREPWDLKQGGRYYFTRNLSTLVAFAVGQEYSAGNPFHMIGAHTDRYALPAGVQCLSTTSCMRL